MLPPAARFSLRTFGGFALVHGARPCDLAYEKGRALLAYLAVEPGRSTRELFWRACSAGSGARRGLDQSTAGLAQLAAGALCRR
jgi:DNA-binding SARP family transcriptional activator